MARTDNPALTPNRTRRGNVIMGPWPGSAIPPRPWRPPPPDAWRPAERRNYSAEDLGLVYCAGTVKAGTRYARRCRNTPERGSAYCEHHQHQAAAP